MTKIASVLVALPLLASTLPVAAETLSSPSTFCHVHAGSGSVYWDGRTINSSSTTTLDLNCPITTSATVPVAKTAKIVLQDRNCQTDVSCRVTSQYMGADGVVYWFQSAEMRSSGCGVAPQTRTASVNLGALGQNLNVQCQVPTKTASGASSLFRYEITR